MHKDPQGTAAPTFRSTEITFFGEDERVPPIEDARVSTFRPGLAYLEWVGKDIVDCPMDFAIREVRDSAVDDDDEVMQFINRWGLIYPQGALGRLPDAFFRANGSVQMLRVLDQDERVGCVSLGMSGVYLHVMKAMADFYLGYCRKDAEQVATAWTGQGFTFAPLESVEASERLAAEVLTQALMVFPPRVSFGGANPATAPSVFSAAMLQLTLMMKTDWSVKFCKNSRCGRPFTRQRGRSRYGEGQHESGVLYCSHRCAKAQSERERRARKRGRSMGDPDGASRRTKGI